MNDNFPEEFSQPLKKRRFGMLTEEDKPHDLKTNAIDFSPSPKISVTQDSPLDFSIKNDAGRGKMSNVEHQITDFHAKEHSNRFGLVSSSGPESEGGENYSGMLEKMSDLHNAYKGKCLKNRLGIFRESTANHLPLPNPYLSNDNFNSESNRSITTNDLLKAPISPLERMYRSPLRVDDAMRDKMNFLNGTNAMLSYKNNLKLHPYQHYPPVTELSPVYPNSLPIPMSSMTTPFKFRVSESTPDNKLSKTIRPFKKFENEILNYDSRYSLLSALPYGSPSFVEQSPKAASPVSPVATIGSSGSPPQPEPSTSTVSNGSGEIENASQNGFCDDQQNPNNLQPGEMPDSCQSTRRKGQKTPDEKKDEIYLEKRRKNNEAAKRSRDARRRKEDQMAVTAKKLLDENRDYLRIMENTQSRNHYLEIEVETLKQQAFGQQMLIEHLQSELERVREGISINGSRTEGRDSKHEQENPGL